MKLLKRIDNVLVVFQGDKANILYENIHAHHYKNVTEMKKDDLVYDDDYFHLDNVPVILVSEKELGDISYYLKDLKDFYLNLTDAYNKTSKEIIKSPCFIITDKYKALFIMTAGYTYPRFKGFVDELTISNI